MNLQDLGWDDFFEKEFRMLAGTGLVPGRETADSRNLYEVLGEDGAVTAHVSGHFQYTAAGRADYPAVGDWVAMRTAGDGTAVIEKVFDRKSRFSRRSSGRAVDEQVIAANIDRMCVVCALDGGRSFNLRGIERYLVLVRESGSDPVLVLNKADLCENIPDALTAAGSIAQGIPVFAVSAVTGEGIDDFARSFLPRTVSAFTGPSGVGKSALINRLLGEDLLRTGDVREDDRRGRHTTTRRELFFLPAGGMVIDTPGLRELQAWGDGAAVDDAFADIARAAEGCRFRDCTHRDEPGCAVQRALRDGAIEHGRFQNYMALRDELAYLNSRFDEKARMEKKRKDKELARRIKEYNKDRE